MMAAVLCPLAFWWSYLGTPYLILITQIVNGIGDGLAEPIGVRFGQNHQYEVRGCFTKNNYVRSYQGSLMVFLSGVVAILYVYFAYGEYSIAQLAMVLISVPIIATVVEAKAPHSLDNPFS